MDKEKIINKMKDISNQTTKAGNELEDSLKYLRDNLKLKLNLWNKEIELKKSFEYLGKLYYKSNMEDGLDLKDESKAVIEKIDQLILDIEILKGEKEIETIKLEDKIFELPTEDKMVICKNCGEKNSEMVMYCKNCNEEL
ncbi:MAG: hypothetical protein Q4P29_01585 [Tissierellia bacterium]|nr:hypothetical protein [Tissierellia bacterium]